MQTDFCELKYPLLHHVVDELSMFEIWNVLHWLFYGKYDSHSKLT